MGLNCTSFHTGVKGGSLRKQAGGELSGLLCPSVLMTGGFSCQVLLKEQAQEDLPISTVAVVGSLPCAFRVVVVVVFICL